MRRGQGRKGERVRVSEIAGRLTDYGFEWGAADVTRICNDKRTGAVVIGVTTPKTGVQIYVTKTGKLRVFSPDGEEWVRGKP